MLKDIVKELVDVCADVGANQAHDELSELVEDPEVDSEEMRDAATRLLDVLNAYYHRRARVVERAREALRGERAATVLGIRIVVDPNMPDGLIELRKAGVL